MKQNFITSTLLIVMALFMLSSCGGQKQVLANENGYKKVEMPFSTPEYRSDANNFRAVYSAKSPDAIVAKKMATVSCRTELASSVSILIKSVNDQYTSQREIGNKAEFERKFEELTKTVVNQVILGSIIIGEDKSENNEGMCLMYIAMELPKQVVKEAIEDAISKDSKLALDFDKHLYEKQFDEEMAKFEQNK